MLVMRQLVSRITHGEPPNSSTLADYFYKGLSDQLRVFLAPMITQEVLTDIDKLYKAAQQAELNFNLSKPYQTQNRQNQQQADRNPSGGLQAKRKGPSGPSAGAQSSGGAAQKSGEQRRGGFVPKGLKPGEPERPPPDPPAAFGHWPTREERRAHKTEWGNDDLCLFCGREAHSLRTCRHPDVSTYTPARKITKADITKIAVSNPVNSNSDVGRDSTLNCSFQDDDALQQHTRSTLDAPEAIPCSSLFSLPSREQSLKMLFRGAIAERQHQWEARSRQQALQENKEGPLDASREAVRAVADPVEVKVLIDTGAGGNFLSLAVLEKLGLSPVYQKQCSPIGLADGTQTFPLGMCELTVSLGSYSEVVSFIVLKTTNPLFQAILGSSWCSAHKTDLLFSKDECVIHFDGSQHTVPCIVPSTEDSIPCVPCSILGPLQFKKCLRSSDFICIASVEQILAHSPTDSDDPELKALLSEFTDVFSSELPDGLPPLRATSQAIPLKDGSVPPSRKMYRMSQLTYTELKRQVLALWKKGLVEPSTSPYGAPVLFAPKPNGTLRLCIDYRALNKQTIRNKYPLPRIDDLLDKLVNMSYFTSLDLTQAYYQVRLQPEDIPKTAFSTPDGLFQFKVLCFGLTNAPATFQALVNEVFGDILGKSLLAYLDDLLIFSKTREEHVQALRTVLLRLRQHKLYANHEKCSFMTRSVQFLGHQTSHQGLKPSEAKSAIVQNWPVPSSVHDVQSFLGLVNYFRKFIQGYSVLAKPLTDLLKANTPFIWSTACQNAFQLLKLELSSAPVLALPNPDLQFELVCDACKDGIGAVLLQTGRPICFEGRKFTEPEQKLDAGEQELIAVIYALNIFRCYLEGPVFTLVTDHLPNTYFATQATLSPKKARWLDFLSRFHFEWVYRPGRLNVADPLSRAQHLPVLSLEDPNLLPALAIVPLFVIRVHSDNTWEAGYAQDSWFADSSNTARLTQKEG